MPPALGRAERVLDADAGKARLSQVDGHQVSRQSVYGSGTGRGRAASTPSSARCPTVAVDEDVEPGEGDEVGALRRRRSTWLSDASWARMIVNSPCATSATPALKLCRLVKPPSRPASQPAADLADERHDDGERDDPADVADRGQVDREPEDEEEERGEDVAEAEEALLDLLADRRLREDDPGHERADRLGQPELLGERRACRRGTRRPRAGRTRAAAGRARGRAVPRASAMLRGPR